MCETFLVFNDKALVAYFFIDMWKNEWLHQFIN